MLLWILLHAHRSSATKSHMSCQLPIWRHWARCCPWMLWVPLHSIIPILDSAGRSWNVHVDENKAYCVVLRSSQGFRLYMKHLYVEYLYALIKMAGNKDNMRFKRKTKSIVKRKSCRDLIQSFFFKFANHKHKHAISYLDPLQARELLYEGFIFVVFTSADCLFRKNCRFLP